MISFEFVSEKERDRILKTSPTKFLDKKMEACFAYYATKYNANSVVVGTLNPRLELVTRLAEWIAHQSSDNIAIGIHPKNETGVMFFDVSISNSYQPLARYVALYLTLITIRLAEDDELFWRRLSLGNIKSLTAKHIQTLNGMGGNNPNHALFDLHGNKYSTLFLPEEVYEKMFNVDAFNSAYLKPFHEYNYYLLNMPQYYDVGKKASQTAYMLRLCRHLKLLEGIREILNANVINDEESLRRVVDSFTSVIPGNSQVTLYSPPEIRFESQLPKRS